MKQKNQKRAFRGASLVAAVCLGVAVGFGGIGTVSAIDLDKQVVYDLGGVKVNQNEVKSNTEVSANGDPVYAGGQVSQVNQIGMMGKQDYMDTPFNVTGYTAKLIENQQSRNVIDVAANDASVSDLTLSGASNAWSIRGFKTTQQDVEFNGVYGLAPRFYTGVESLARVEIIKGPTAMLSGMAPNSSIGGTVNYVPKRAGAEPLNRVTMTYGEGHQFTQHLDIGRRFNDGKYGVRINVLNRNKGETASPDEQNSASTVTVALDAKGERFRTSLDLGYVYNDIENPQYRVSISEKVAATMSSMIPAIKDGKFGAPDTYRRITEKYGLWKGEYDVNNHWTAYAGIGMRSTSIDYLYNQFVLSDNKGNAKVTYKHNGQVNKGYTVDVGARGTYETGKFLHQINIGASRVNYTRYMNNRNILVAGTKAASTGWKTSLYNPTFGTYVDDGISYLPIDSQYNLSSMAISDVISTRDLNTSILIGARLQNIKADVYDNGSLSQHYDETVTSPGFGIIHRLNDRTAVYANFSQALAIDSAPSSAANADQLLAPYKAKQYEAGVKYDLGKFAVTADVFRIDTPSVLTDPDTNIASMSGKQRNQGFEINFFGEPMKGTRILGGFTWMDAKYLETAGGAYDGNTVAAVPKYNAVISVDQDIKRVPGLALTTRLVYNGSAYINASNTLSVSPWLRWDLGARYKFDWARTPVTVRLDVLNVMDKQTWRALENAVYLGNGRTYIASVSMDF